MNKIKIMLLLGCINLIGHVAYAAQCSFAQLNIKDNVTLNDRFIDAADKGELENMLSVLNEGADINAKNKWGQTALIRAARNGRIKIVKALVEAKADLNAQADDDRTALMTAASASKSGAPIASHKEIIILLLEAGADPLIKTNQQPPQSFLSMLKGQYKALLHDIEIQKKIKELDIYEEPKKEKSNSLHKEKNKKSEWIGGFCYTPHAFEQMEARKIKLNDVMWILKHGKPCKDKDEPDCLKFFHPSKNIGIVVVEKTKTIKTVINPKDSDALKWWIEKKQV